MASKWYEFPSYKHTDLLNTQNPVQPTKPQQSNDWCDVTKRVQHYLVNYVKIDCNYNVITMCNMHYYNCASFVIDYSTISYNGIFTLFLSNHRDALQGIWG